jgi:Uma2 family endonuclease
MTYPESDGKPVAENTLQFRWITTIEGGLDALFRDDPSVFVAGDLLWYPVEGANTICRAPDSMVVFGRPKGDRGSYLQWQEDNIAPQVVFEVLSPSDRGGELLRKFEFYGRYGVEEYYIYDPDFRELWGWLREGESLREVLQMEGWISPRLKVRFHMGDELEMYGPDGQKFLTYLELVAQRDQALRAAHEQAAEIERLTAQLRALGVEPKS